ncbi:MAG: hemolysin III family protein [Isosphaeraceae bacterium]
MHLDGVGIFALIAGSYTPIGWTLIRGRWRRWTLATVWAMAAAATILIATGRAQSAALDRPLSGDLRDPRVVPPVRAGG